MHHGGVAGVGLGGGGLCCGIHARDCIGPGRGGGRQEAGALRPDRNPARVLQQKGQEHDSVEENEEAEYAQRKLLGESVRAA